MSKRKYRLAIHTPEETASHKHLHVTVDAEDVFKVLWLLEWAADYMKPEESLYQRWIDEAKKFGPHICN